MTETTESKSTLDIASGSDSTGSKEALVESEIGTTRLSVDEGARRKRLLYAGLLAAGTLAVTAMIIAGFASSAGSVERGAAGATTDFEETENPWPTAQGRILTKEENYYYYRTRSAEKADADTKPNSKRSPSQARKKKRRPKTTARRTKPTTTTTVVTTVPPDDRSQETEQPGSVSRSDFGEEHASRSARATSPSKRTRKPAGRLLSDGTESTHKSSQATPSEDKSRTG